MKVAILAGGLGSRLQEETTVRPKPMVEIGGKPMLWHIMNIYAWHGFREFVIALGYKGEVIKEYFLNFYALNNDLTVNLSTGKLAVHDGRQPDWRVHLVETGQNTMTGGRIKRLGPWLGDGTFMATYGDGLADVPVEDVLGFHRAHGKLATVTAVRPPARFGGLQIESRQVVKFAEKPQTGEGWINGGFFVFEPGALDYIDGDATSLELEPLERLVAAGQLMAYEHRGFWQPMDTLREKNLLEDLWRTGKAPWKVWP
ncbi:MAG: glucose-1-phosphate cytidylyltransferase [Armatimonadetes bacterium]|nr:glucose-1-phosphate cytidylyltransferase [Armatimonadota bacterium]